MDGLIFQKPTRVLYHLLIGCALLAVTACTSEKDQPASIRLDLSSYTGSGSHLKSQSTSSSAQIGMIAVSVSGPGMAAVTDNWQGFNCRTGCVPPRQMELAVPSGSDRLIQLLLVIEDPDTRAMAFLYGETKANLAPGPQSVSLKLSAVGGSSGKEASVHGRYFLPGGTAYTGKVHMGFVPPSGSAPMKLFETEMYSGWINLFALDGARFTYVIPGVTPHVLFGGPIHKNSPVFQDTANTLKITIPQTKETYTEGGIEFTETRPEKDYVVAFWAAGQPMPGKMICHIDGTTEFSFSGREISEGVDLNWTDFTFNPSGKDCDEINEDDDLPLVETGKIRLHPRVFEDTGGDQLFSQGPFMRSRFESTEYRYLDYSLAGDGTLSLNWVYMPGVFGGVNPIKGVKIFGRSDPADSEPIRLFDGLGSPGCREAASLGFKELKTIANNENTATITGVSPDMQVIVCPFRGTELMHTGISTHDHHSCGPGGCGPENPATKLVLVPPPGFTGYVNNDACVPMRIEAQDDSGNLGYLSEDTNNFSISVSGVESSGVYIYDDPSCISDQFSSYPQPLRNHSQVIFVKVSTPNTLPISNGYSLALSGVSGSNPLESTSLDSVEIREGTDTDWVLLGPPQVYSTECTQFMIQTQDANGQPVNTSANRDFSVIGTSGADTYSGPGCEEWSISGNFEHYSGTNLMFYLRPDNLGPNGFITLEQAQGFSQKTHNFDVVDPGPATYIVLHETNGGTTMCKEISVEMYTGQGIRAYPDSNRTIQVDLSIVSGAPSTNAYTTNSCTTQFADNQINFTSSDQKMVFYVSGNISEELLIEAYDLDGANPLDSSGAELQITIQP